MLRSDCQRGFTLIELVVTLAIVAMLGMLTVPVVQVGIQRTKEAELRRALHEIRTALDAYKKASEAGLIKEPESLTSGYPPSLDILASGVDRLNDKTNARLYFLRRVPRDPMNKDETLTASSTWGKRSYDSETANPQEGADVYDVFSRSLDVGLNGVPYSAW